MKKKIQGVSHATLDMASRHQSNKGEIQHLQHEQKELETNIKISLLESGNHDALSINWQALRRM